MCARRISAPSSTSTAAAWTWCSRTTRTRSRRRVPPATRFARFWLHNGWVTMGGEKMSKSLGNVLVDSRCAATGSARRVALLPGQRALPVDARVLRDRAAGRGEGLHRHRGLPAPCAQPGRRRRARRAGRPKFAAALDDDLAVPIALAEVHSARADGNRALDAGPRRRPGARVVHPRHDDANYAYLGTPQLPTSRC